MLQIDIWSDVACPFCYIGKRSFEGALATFEHADEVDVRWHSFELDPHAPSVPATGIYELLAAKYGVTREQAVAMNERVAAMAATVGLTLDFDAIKPTSTFAAHRVLQYAATEDLQAAAAEELFAAYFTKGANLADPDELADAVAVLGLDRARLRAVAAGDEFAGQVRADEARAVELGVTGVPYFLVQSRYAVSGAQPRETFEKALVKAWDLVTADATAS
ncbi:DsbA family oxidoreductase [Frankia sp. AgB1.9]|uniref:DsbA family oxidoreductase n=1 Tax=unclassified Frankia TaxID=2632575 RepID=UPI0019349F97|nr:MULTISPECIES: DsbA family oxidoreductase [unclassified Frankia]MBL7491418.1 DsbA family oxidoreductase [Frankia sp. AgW1.1]MBL7553758.1 DsbA family oxidoreductase [Frankia sp. AgB1.9]MBL7618103.1 DsbA family oxidoreductase [Frankia sp. AgB1.8]